jgi:Helix-turn-helix domain
MGQAAMVTPPEPGASDVNGESPDAANRFGAELRKLMDERGVGVRELARRTGYTPGYISNVRSGNKPSSPRVAGLMDSALEAGGRLIEAERAARGQIPPPRRQRRVARATGVKRVSAVRDAGQALSVLILPVPMCQTGMAGILRFAFLAAGKEAVNGREIQFMCEARVDPRVGYLDRLGAELLAMGVKCELVTTGMAPRLRLDMPWNYHDSDDDFQDNIVVSSQPDGVWRFWWPWGCPIAPADDIPRSVDFIYGIEPGMWIEQ